MKYVLRYSPTWHLNGEPVPPNPHQILELVLGVQAQTGDECESVELVADARCRANYLYLIPWDEDELGGAT